MDTKLRLKDIQKYHHMHILASSGNGIELRAVCDFASDKIIYNVYDPAKSLIDIALSLSEAVKLYNELLD